MSDLVFLDIETLGIEVGAPIWEFAALRVTRDGEVLAKEHFYLRHGAYTAETDRWLADLPGPFILDYRRRYDDNAALYGMWAATHIAHMTAPGRDGQVKLAGSNPMFDMQHLEPYLLRHGITPAWHYHPLDIPSMVLGYLAAKGRLHECPDWRSNPLSRAVGVDPDLYGRHTAEGDVRWTFDQWKAITHG